MAFAPVYFTSLGGSILQYGMVTTFATLISIPSTIVGGVLTQRYSLKKIAVLASLFGLCTSLGYYFCTSWLTVGILTLIAGAGTIGSTAWQQLVADSTVHKNRTTQLSLYQTLTTIPSIFSPLLGGYIIHSMGAIDGFKLGILISLAISPLSIVLILRFLHENKPKSQIQNPPFPDKQREFASVLCHYKDFYKNLTLLPKALVPFLTAIALVVMANSMINPYLIFYATSIAKLDSFQWGMILSCQILFANIIRTPLGMVSDKFDKKKMLLLSVLMTAPIPIFLIFVKSVLGILGILLVLIATGISYGPTHEALQIEITPRERRPALFAIYNVLRSLSSSAGTIIGAILFTANFVLPFYGFAIVEGCASAILALSFLRKLGEKRPVALRQK